MAKSKVKHKNQVLRLKARKDAYEDMKDKKPNKHQHHPPGSNKK